MFALYHNGVLVGVVSDPPFRWMEWGFLDGGKIEAQPVSPEVAEKLRNILVEIG